MSPHRDRALALLWVAGFALFGLLAWTHPNFMFDPLFALAPANLLPFLKPLRKNNVIMKSRGRSAWGWRP